MWLGLIIALAFIVWAVRRHDARTVPLYSDRQLRRLARARAQQVTLDAMEHKARAELPELLGAPPDPQIVYGPTPEAAHAAAARITRQATHPPGR
jgi:hypothetical protein